MKPRRLRHVLTGSMTTDTPVARTSFELEDGTRLVFDGEMAWTSPADSTFSSGIGARPMA